MLKRFAIVALFVIVSNFAHNSQARAVTNATFFVGGVTGYACTAGTGNTSLCTPPVNVSVSCLSLPGVILHVYVGNQDIPTYCGSSMACICWNQAYYHSGSLVSVYGKLIPNSDGETTMNWVLSITNP